MVKKALAIDSMSAETHAIEGTLHLLKADEEKDGPARLNLIHKGQASLEHALKIKRWLKHEYSPVLEKANKIISLS